MAAYLTLLAEHHLSDESPDAYPIDYSAPDYQREREHNPQVNF